MAAKRTTILRQAILEALDPFLERCGFSRAKRSFEWSRRPRPGTLHGIHVNVAAYESVGRVHMIPTLEAGLERVEQALAEAAGREPGKGSIQFSRRLTTLLGCEYVASVEEDPAPMAARLAADIERHGLPCLERLSSLDQLAESLASPNAREWPIALGRDRRAQLLPLVLALTGRTGDALDCFARLRHELSEQGGLTPEISAFGAWLQRRFG